MGGWMDGHQEKGERKKRKESNEPTHRHIQTLRHPHIYPHIISIPASSPVVVVVPVVRQPGAPPPPHGPPPPAMGAGSSGVRRGGGGGGLCLALARVAHDVEEGEDGEDLFLFCLGFALGGMGARVVKRFIERKGKAR